MLHKQTMVQNILSHITGEIFRTLKPNLLGEWPFHPPPPTCFGKRAYYPLSFKNIAFKQKQVRYTCPMCKWFNPFFGLYSSLNNLISVEHIYLL